VTAVLHGRCSCGAIRFAASAEPLQVSWCHCRDCRRQTGAPAVVWAGFRVEDFAWQGEPKRRRSSAQVTRAFCAECGTPISYEHEGLAGEIYIHAGLFDEADRLVPDRQAYVTSKLFWMHLEDGLYASDTTTRERRPPGGR
jgi:hypothetical protein